MRPLFIYIRMTLFVQWLENHLLTCPYKAMTGIDCPGCGMQRAVVELLKGNLSESLYLYPALIPIIFTLSFTCLHLYFKFKYGAMVVKYSFIISSLIIFVAYILKLLR